MNEILSRLHELADRDVHRYAPFGITFKFMLSLDNKPEIARESLVDEVVALSAGVPHVGRVSIDDNDFWEMQSDEWKNANKELCKEGTWFRIDEIMSTEFVDNDKVKVTTKRLYVTFGDDKPQDA